MRRQTAQQSLHQNAGAGCTIIAGTNVVLAYAAVERRDVWLADVSHLPRIGLKGPGAGAWLQSHGIDVPARANAWLPLESELSVGDWSLVARLGNTEFLLEQDGDAALIARLGVQLSDSITGVYPVLREDSAFVLGGPRAASLLNELCNIDFARIVGTQRSAVLTLMVGVAVLVIPQFDGAARRYRIWCDPSFGAYLWMTLTDVIAHHSGAVLGLTQLAAPPRLPPGTERTALGED